MAAAKLDHGIMTCYEGCSIKTEYNFEKKYLYFRNYSIFTTAPSRYSSLGVVYFTQRLCHSSNM